MRYNFSSGSLSSKSDSNGGPQSPSPPGTYSGSQDSNGTTNNQLVRLWHKLLGTTTVHATTDAFYSSLPTGEISMSMSTVRVKPTKFTQQFERAYLQVMGAWQAMVRAEVRGQHCDEAQGQRFQGRRQCVERICAEGCDFCLQDVCVLVWLDFLLVCEFPLCAPSE